MIREAFLCWEEGLASADDIDRIVTASFGLRLASAGPLRNADLGGLDTYRSILEVLSARLGERFEVPQSLNRLVESGRLGAKSGAGISTYDAGDVTRIERERDERLGRVIVALEKE
jgi:3-hydroxybutyryl-CoA dehydrogenase